MTICVAYKSKGKVFCASDTLISADLDCGRDTMEKIFEKNGIIYCVAGDCKANMGLRYEFNFKKPANATSADDVVFNHFRNKLKKFLKDNEEYLNEEKEFVGELMIIVDNQIYVFNPDYSITKPTTNFYCIGCGADIGFGALGAIQEVKGLSTRDKVNIAIHTAGKYSTGCNEEVRWFN